MISGFFRYDTMPRISDECRKLKQVMLLAFQVPQGILKLLDAHPELSDKSAGDT